MPGPSDTKTMDVQQLSESQVAAGVSVAIVAVSWLMTYTISTGDPPRILVSLWATGSFLECHWR